MKYWYEWSVRLTFCYILLLGNIKGVKIIYGSMDGFKERGGSCFEGIVFEGWGFVKFCE